MPIVVPTIGLITRPEEAVEMLSELITDNAERLGIQYVGHYEEKLMPRYPAVVLSSGATDKAPHATHTFAIALRVTLWVYHAKMTLTHKERSEEDLLLATALTLVLEEDKTFNNRVIFGYVESEVPGVIAPRAGRGEMIVGTKMNWEASTQKRWD